MTEIRPVAAEGKGRGTSAKELEGTLRGDGDVRPRGSAIYAAKAREQMSEA